MASAYELTLGIGRIRLHLSARCLGKDMFISVAGGQAHVGAVALAAADSQEQVLQCPGHRDGEIAACVARIIAQGANCHVAVACGIHYNCITDEEIAIVRRLACCLAESFLGEYQTQGKHMLKKTDLEQFEQQLQSGAIDDAFKYGDEQERGEILELLEKIMDVADLANEVATRLIFRGRIQ